MRGQRGLTMVEMMVAVAIFGALSAAIFAALDQSRQLYQGGDLQIFLQQEARAGLEEFLDDIRESAPSTVTIYQYTDPLDGKLHQAIAFASARGDSNVAGEGSCLGSPQNNCFHTASGNPSWRSLVVYAFYQTATPLKQLRRYVNYTGVTYTDPVFPFTFQSVTATQITVRSADGTNVVITRGPDAPTGGSPRVIIADLLEHEDQDNDAVLDPNENDGSQSLPADDRDGVMDYGARFSPYPFTGRLVTLSLFLRKAQMSVSNSSTFIVVNLDGTSELRN